MLTRKIMRNSLDTSRIIPNYLISKIILAEYIYNTPRFSDRHNYGGMTRNRYICKKEENQNGKTI